MTHVQPARLSPRQALLEDVQNHRTGLTKKMKAAVDVVMAANRLKNFLETVQQPHDVARATNTSERRDKATVAL